MSRSEKRKEKERVLAEMREALKEEEEKTAPAEEEPKPAEEETDASGNPATMHCRKCGTEMENGVCPKCGYKVYMPMDAKKAAKIRWILGGIVVAAFLIWVIVKQIKG